MGYGSLAQAFWAEKSTWVAPQTYGVWQDTGDYGYGFWQVWQYGIFIVSRDGSHSIR